MPNFSYTKIADYILDDLFGFAEINSLKNSLRYIAEDILGDPSTNSDAINFSSITGAAANAVIETYTRPTGSTVTERGVATSASSGSFSHATATYTDITNLSVTISTTGRPVFICLVSASGASDSRVGVFAVGAASTNGRIRLLRGASNVAEWMFIAGGAVGTLEQRTPVSLVHVDFPAAGTYAYKMQARALDQIQVTNQKLAAFEL